MSTFFHIKFFFLHYFLYRFLSLSLSLSLYIYIYIYIIQYEGHLINERIFSKKLAMETILNTCNPFQENRWLRVISCPRTMSTSTSLLTIAHRTDSYRRARGGSNARTVFLTKVHHNKPMSYPYVKSFN